ncbi:hypothetical protein SAMN04487949_1833 [Halogranum gelatinilyticum]|uniref:Uncharacterized protein n=1 Tax=Halogranum gelatinilyticum TaxID=660521 RepID=A0A1G9TM74_9EURY|nr:hypothetical protein [Halogranum gelatinilyticum]SDM48909.1 hypothetical protein SAMN04487949_1833 [Halogranum gelatinilyticum]
MSLRPALSALLDLVLATFGYFIVLFGPAAVVASVTMPPAPSAQRPVLAVVGVAALAAAVWHVRAGKSLAPLGEFFFTVMALQVLSMVPLIPAFYLLRWQGVSVELPTELGALYVLAVYGVTYVHVYRDGWERLKTRVAGS